MERFGSSGLQTADAAIATKKGILAGVTLVPDGTNAVTLILYDNDSAASGTVLWKGRSLGTVNLDVTNLNIQFTNGIYADVTGTNAAYLVRYKTL